tara:strand:+ start:2352 stop:2633 length:282 start_codon:yes stop_codon:yes gene_type:complete
LKKKIKLIDDKKNTIIKTLTSCEYEIKKIFVLIRNSVSRYALFLLRIFDKYVTEKILKIPIIEEKYLPTDASYPNISCKTLSKKLKKNGTPSD